MGKCIEKPPMKGLLHSREGMPWKLSPASWVLEYLFPQPEKGLHFSYGSIWSCVSYFAVAELRNVKAIEKEGDRIRTHTRAVIPPTPSSLPHSSPFLPHSSHYLPPPPLTLHWEMKSSRLASAPDCQQLHLSSLTIILFQHPLSSTGQMHVPPAAVGTRIVLGRVWMNGKSKW